MRGNGVPVHSAARAAVRTSVALAALLLALWLATADSRGADLNLGLLGLPACSDNIDNDGDGGTDHDGGILGLPPDPACASPSQNTEGGGSGAACEICVDFVTTHDPPGPAEPRTRMHRNVIANVPYALDVDGTLDPSPLGALPILPGFELRVTVEGLDASNPTIRFEKLLGAPPQLPLRIEALRGSERKISFGYDTLNSAAPQSFVANLDLRDRDGDPETTQTRAVLTIEGAGDRLTIVNEEFAGDPVDARTDRDVKRLEFGGNPLGGTRVPARATVDLTTTTRLDPETEKRKVVKQLREPEGASTTGSVENLPARVDVTISEEDVNDDDNDDTKFVYTGSDEVDRAEVRTDDGEGSTARAVVEGVPAGETTITYAESSDPDEAEVTYHAPGRIANARLGLDDGSRQINAEVVEPPADIDLLKYTAYDAPDEGGEVSYSASDSVPHLEIRIEETTGGEPREIAAVIEGLPSVIELLKLAKTDDDLEAIYAANAQTAGLELDGTGFEELPGDATEGHLRLRRIPQFLGAQAQAFETQEETRVPAPGPPPNKCEDVPDLCDPRTECFEEDPPPDCVFAADVTETTKHSSLLLTTLGGEVGLAELQLTSGADDRLADEAANGRPQDGVLLRDLADRHVVFARISELVRLGMSQDSFKKEAVGVTGPGSLPFERSTTNVELDSRTDDHALAIDTREQEGSNVKAAQALLDELPEHVNVQVSDAAGRGITDRSEFNYDASQAVDGGFSLVATEQTGEGEPEVAGRVTLDPMPATFRVCQEDFVGCSEGVFDENIEKLANGETDHDDCVPGCPGAPDLEINPQSGTSLLLTANPATEFHYEVGNTSIDLFSLTRYGLQAFATEYDCALDLLTCKRGYVAMDSGGDQLAGRIVQPDTDTFFRFPAGWSADRHVWGFERSPVTAGVAMIGPVNCPSGTIGGTALSTGGEDFTELFCTAEINDAQEIVDGILNAITGAIEAGATPLAKGIGKIVF